MAVVVKDNHVRLSASALIERGDGSALLGMLVDLIYTTTAARFGRLV